QHSIDALNGFTSVGGNAPSVTHPQLTYTDVTMSGAADYTVGGYALTAAQLGMPTIVQSAQVSGPSGLLSPLPYSWPAAAASAQYNASTSKLQFFDGNGAELTANAKVGGSWRIVARGY